jgi:hypothetical protein
MRLLGRASIVAAVAAVLLVVGVRAEAQRAEPRPAPSQGAPSDVTVASAAVAERPVLFARVTKPFGAPVRAVPSPDSATVLTSACGDVWPVLAVERGWVKVRTETGTEWIGVGRVDVSTEPPDVDCSAARFILPAGYAEASVGDGCLILRTRPSDEAPSLDCVEDGHVYAVLDGPFDPGTGEDWFRVSSPSTGSGWARADHLYPT